VQGQCSDTTSQVAVVVHVTQGRPGQGSLLTVNRPPTRLCPLAVGEEVATGNIVLH
jgi:hypothetical protein